MTDIYNTSRYDYMEEFIFTKEIRQLFSKISRSSFPVQYKKRYIGQHRETLNGSLRLYALLNACETEQRPFFYFLEPSPVLRNIYDYNHFYDERNFSLLNASINNALTSTPSINELETKKIINIVKKLGEGVQGSVSSIELDQSIKDTCPVRGKDNQPLPNVKKIIVPELYDVKFNDGSDKQAVMKISSIYSYNTFPIIQALEDFSQSGNFPMTLELRENIQSMLKTSLITDSITDIAISTYTSDYKEYGLTPFFPTCYTSLVTLQQKEPSKIKPINMNSVIKQLGLNLDDSHVKNFISYFRSRQTIEEPVTLMLSERLDFTLTDFISDSQLDSAFLSSFESLMAQIIFGLSFAQSSIHYVHGDFHASNVMIKNVNYPYLFYRLNLSKIYNLSNLLSKDEFEKIVNIINYLNREYGQGGYIYYKIPTYGKVACAIDNGRSHIRTEFFHIYNNIEKKIFEQRGEGVRIPLSFNEDVYRLVSSFISFRNMQWLNSDIMNPTSINNQGLNYGDRELLPSPENNLKMFINAVRSYPRTINPQDMILEYRNNSINQIPKEQNGVPLGNRWRFEENRHLLNDKTPFSFIYYFEKYIIPESRFFRDVKDFEAMVYDII